jgi:hypothetical protein
LENLARGELPANLITFAHFSVSPGDVFTELGGPALEDGAAKIGNPRLD